MEDVAIARAVHVLAVIHWIGGVSLVTLVILPSIMRLHHAESRLSTFEAIEGRFGQQARISTLLAGLSGFYMTHRMSAWDRFLEPAFWWMHIMVLVWALFTFVLFVAEPLFLHRWFHDRAQAEPEGTFRLVFRFHIVLLTLSLIAAGGAILGAHGALH